MGAAGYERLAPAPRRLRAALDGWGPALCSLLIAALIFVGVFSLVWLIGTSPAYAVAIPSASGLDYRDGQGQPPVLDPLFNLTVRIASQSGVRGRECANPTTSVHVLYMGVQLAAARVPPGALCAAPWRSEEQGVVARGRGVAMSPFLLDTLAEDVANGDALFEVLLMSPQGNHWEVYTCMAKIGRPAADCAWSYVQASDMPAGQQQRSG